MREVIDCIPCYLKQVMNVLQQAGIGEGEGQRILRAVLPLISQQDPGHYPAENFSYILHRTNELIDQVDPFREAKQKSNQAAMVLLPKLREIIISSEDPLFTACQISGAGNVIDMAILPDYDVEASLEDAFRTVFARSDYEDFRERLAAAGLVLILGDNSGEIAFDRLLVEQIRSRGLEVVYAVKGGPVLNDATIEDADQTGMNEVARVIDNGNNFVGTNLKYCSAELKEVFSTADIVISKGQGNYECLEGAQEAGDKTFFLLRAKCPVVARQLGVKLGEMAFSRNRPA